MALELARAIESCAAGDHTAIPKVLSKAMQELERTKGR